VLKCRREFLELISERASTGRPLAMNDTPDWLPPPVNTAADDGQESQMACATCNAA
jgi:hypothetical protein